MTSASPAVKLDHVSKLYHHQKQKTLKELVHALLKHQPTGESFWALRHINLTVSQGETVGIIGPNGSGKSTLLKLIAGVSQPTKGKITVNGRIAPLIELGAGFHPELSGRENIFLNGVILGMSRQEIEQKFDQIVDFAELWQFIDQPVKHYSSGMYLRLAFAVAVHTQPDILLVDEILAVGDESFQKKCFDKMAEFQKKGCTIIYVTHALATLENFCHRVILLDHGKIIFSGPAKTVIQHYQAQVASLYTSSAKG